MMSPNNVATGVAAAPAAQSSSGADLLRAFGAGWMSAPWGIVAVGSDGKICAINPAFERCTGMVGTDLIGLDEAVLDLRLEMTLFDHRRIEVNTSGVLAVHYISNAVAEETIAQKLARVAESLREPLTCIYGFTELMLKQDYNPEQNRELLFTMLAQIEQISGIINTQLDQAAAAQ